MRKHSAKIAYFFVLSVLMLTLSFGSFASSNALAGASTVKAPVSPFPTIAKTKKPTQIPSITPSPTSTPLTGLTFTSWDYGCTATPYITCSAGVVSTHTDPYRWDFDVTFTYGDNSDFFGSTFSLDLHFNSGVFQQEVPIWWNMYPIVNEVMPNRSIDVFYPVSDLPSMSYPSGTWTIEPVPYPWDGFTIHFDRVTGEEEVLVRTDAWHFTIATYPNVATPTITPIHTTTPVPSFTSTNSPTPTFSFISTNTPTNTPTPPLSYIYDRNAAVWYANRWAHDRNPDFPNYGTGCECDDCTNYTSQILFNGNYPLRTGNYDVSNPSEWWYKKLPLGFTNSNTWSATDWFRNYAENFSQEFEFRSSPTDLDPGDFLLLDLMDNATGDLYHDGIPDHMRVIIGYGYTSTEQVDYNCGENTDIPPVTYTLLINQHCVDRWHVIWNYRLKYNDGKWPLHVK